MKLNWYFNALVINLNIPLHIRQNQCRYHRHISWPQRMDCEKDYKTIYSLQSCLFLSSSSYLQDSLPETGVLGEGDELSQYRAPQSTAEIKQTLKRYWHSWTNLTYFIHLEIQFWSDKLISVKAFPKLPWMIWNYKT